MYSVMLKLLNGGAMVEWRIFNNSHRQFVKECRCPPLWRHRPQWRVYVVSVVNKTKKHYDLLLSGCCHVLFEKFIYTD